MNKIDSSLCATCIYKKTCRLTESKRFIWSCSEFDSDESHRHEETEILKPKLELKKPKLELMKPKLELI